VPLALSSIAVFLNQWMQATRYLAPVTSSASAAARLTSPSTTADGALFNRALLASVCPVIGGIASAAFLQFYSPLLNMLNSIADSPPFAKTADALLRAGDHEVYVNQHDRTQHPQGGRPVPHHQRGGGQQRVGGDDDALRQAIAASLADQQRHQQQQSGNRNNNNNNANVGETTTIRNPDGSETLIRARGGGGRSSAAAATTQNNNNNNFIAPITPTERESIQFLKDMTGRTGNEEDQHLLQILRSCGGDANQAAALLLEGM
jgi:hypothetical protein